MILLVLILLIGCDVNDGRGECLEEHYILSVEVGYSDDTNVLLDKFRVVNVNTREDLSLNDGVPSIIDKMTGIYPIVDDSQKEKFLHHSSVDVLFTGYIKDKEVCSRTFSIAADDCHVYLMKGDTELIIGK